MANPNTANHWWRDLRVWRLAGQVGVLLLVIGAIATLGFNLDQNLKRLGITLSFQFLGSQVGFDIREPSIPFRPTDTYARALLIGLLNTLKVSIIGIFLATLVGITVGIARLSSNWLVRQMALVYIEIVRNVPLPVQLLFWYFAVFLQLLKAPTPGNGLIAITNRGIGLPGGILLSPEFAALLVGLTLYTATFIAEIVRSGIQSVPKGQWEAASALGLAPGQTLRFVIGPQALRVIIPSLTGQYLNLAKNSSLAIVVGYEDLYRISATTLNQTSRAVEVMLILMAAYLTLSLAIASLANLHNRSVQIVER